EHETDCTRFGERLDVEAVRVTYLADIRRLMREEISLVGTGTRAHHRMRPRIAPSQTPEIGAPVAPEAQEPVREAGRVRRRDLERAITAVSELDGVAVADERRSEQADDREQDHGGK